MISVYLQGRFGNHLFQYVITRLVAMRNGYKFHIPRENFIPKTIFTELNLGEENFNQEYVFWENQEQVYDESVFNVPDNTTLIGFFQTEKYFIGNESVIKTWFKDDLSGYQTEENVCLIHFRGGDYNELNLTLPKEYYDKAKRLIIEENPNVVFKIITDDPNKAREIFTDEIVLGEQFDDFKKLRTAKYLIISNSSFSWWAAWLNDVNALTLAPERWWNYSDPTKDWFPFDIKTEKFKYL